MDCKAGDVHFWSQTLTENLNDYLHFYVDNVLQNSWSGRGYRKASFPVTEGIHTFTWEYEKNGSLSDDDDVVSIDDITFPLKGAYVEPNGACGNKEPCHFSIQDAIDYAVEGTTIRVAEGTYAENIVIDKNVTVEPGWDADFTTRTQTGPAVLTGP